MKFSNQTNADAGSPNPEAGAAKVSGAVKTYHGNPEWDERERVSGKIYRAGRCEKTYRNQNGGFTAVFEKTPSPRPAALGGESACFTRISTLCWTAAPAPGDIFSPFRWTCSWSCTSTAPSSTPPRTCTAWFCSRPGREISPCPSSKLTA